jgi:hypothetical protein
MSELTSSPGYKRRYVILYTKIRDFEVAISIMEAIGMTEYFWSYLNNFVHYNDELLHFVFNLDILSVSVCENFVYLPYQRKCKTSKTKNTGMTPGCMVWEFLDNLWKWVWCSMHVLLETWKSWKMYPPSCVILIPTENQWI